MYMYVHECVKTLQRSKRVKSSCKNLSAKSNQRRQIAEQEQTHGAQERHLQGCTGMSLTSNEVQLYITRSQP